MATYKNISMAAHVHAGQVIAPGGSFQAQATPNLDTLVKAGLLEQVAGRSSPPGSTGSVGAGASGEDKAALVARAKELGVPNAGANWGEEKLKVAIAEAEKKAGAGGDTKDA